MKHLIRFIGITSFILFSLVYGINPPQTGQFPSGFWEHPVTNIRYDLPEDADVMIRIFDIQGRMVKTLVSGQEKAGRKSIVWNATNNLGEPISAGMYIYMIQAGEFRQVRKMVLLK